MQNIIQTKYHMTKYLTKYLIAVFVFLFSFISVSFACDSRFELQQKITEHRDAIEKYTESKDSINQSLNKITKNTNGFLVKKLITYKQNKFNTLVVDLIETENRYIDLASSTENLICKELDKKQELELRNIEENIILTETSIIEQKSEIEEYIKKDLRKILTDLKTISISSTNIKEQKDKEPVKETLKK